MRKYLYLPFIAVTVLCMGLLLHNCGDNGNPVECEANEDCPEGYWCNRTTGKCECIKQCTGKCCGDDGCGGTCTDNCQLGFVCDPGTCMCVSTGCTQDSECGIDQCCLTGACTDMYCGGDTWQCGLDTVCVQKSCGSCGANTHCDNHMCVADQACDDDGDCQADECCVGTPGVCQPENCTGLDCGPDPVCGHSCGTCTPPATCVNGHCQGTGTGALGDPCAYPWDPQGVQPPVNESEGDCNAGLECLGIAADGTSGGTCPGGLDSECTSLLEEWNRDCVNGNCGASFCSQACDAQGN